MNIDNKLPLFRSFLADPKLNLGQGKTTLGQTSVTSTEQKSVNLELQLNEEKKALLKKEQHQKRENGQQEKSQKKTNQETIENKTENKINLKLLNLL